MKSLIFISVVCFLFSCTSGVKLKNELSTKGEVEVENGMGQKVKIPYEILYASASDSVKRMTLNYFNKIVNDASVVAKYRCKFKPTYEPIIIDLMLQKGFNPDATMNNDSITTVIEFRAKNAFGVPDDLKSYSIFKNSNEIESF